MDHSPAQGQHNSSTSNQEDSALARRLTGELYCIGCGYNLRGLSIRSNCSECGIPVRATILGIVDPLAEELVPLSAPRLSACGLLAWSFGGMLAVTMVWVMRLTEVLRDLAGVLWSSNLLPWIGIVGVIVSMLGGFTMIRPHRGVRRFDAIRSAFGVSLYAPLAFVYSAIYLGYDLSSTSPLLEPGPFALERSALRVLLFVVFAGIVWGLRPQAVGLATRSVVVRTGRVDRQSLLTVLASFGVAAVGDLLNVLSTFVRFGFDDVLSIVSVVLVALGSALFTVGMVNICIDTVRLFPVLVRPGVGLSDIFETNRQKSERTSSIED